MPASPRSAPNSAAASPSSNTHVSDGAVAVEGVPPDAAPHPLPRRHRRRGCLQPLHGLDRNVINRWRVADVRAVLAGPGRSLARDDDRLRPVPGGALPHGHRHPVETRRHACIRAERVPAIGAQRREGDIVNVISTRAGKCFASYVGLAVPGTGSRRHVQHSSMPHVRGMFDA